MSLFSKIKNEIVGGAEAAFSSVKAEVTKLEKYIETKVQSIEAHNKHLLSIQNLIAFETKLKDEAEAALAKIKSIL